MRSPGFSAKIKRWGIPIACLYLVLLAVSHFYLHGRSDAKPPADLAKKLVKVDGKTLAYLEWGGADKSLPPLILIHGSPGTGAHDWSKFAPELAATGRRVLAIDRWGYGNSEPRVEDYSYPAQREAVLGLMEQLGIRQAHLAGWSYGAGPAILMGELDGPRVLSVSLIAGMGIQQGEGSGSYTVEHWKYAVLYALVTCVPEAIPHFGLLGRRSARRAFARDFTDCDQRQMAARLTTVETPLFIIHGKNDPLIAAWVAQEHHRLNSKSRLVILDGSHFFPLRMGDLKNFEIATGELNHFLSAAEQGRASKLYGVRNETSREDLRALWDGGFAVRGYKPWWLVAMAGMVLGFILPRTGGILAGVLGSLLILDFVTGISGVVLGALIKRGESRTRYHKAALALACGILGTIPGAILLPLF